MPYQHPENNFSTTLASAHAVSDGELALTSATGLGSLLSYEVYRVTALSNAGTASEAVLGIFEATGLTGATLTGVTAVEGYSDRTLASGTTIQIRATAKTFSELQAALHTIESDYLTSASELAPDNLAAGTAAIDISGNAATATAATTATTAGSATALSTTVASGKLWGGAGTGVPSAVTVGTGLSLSGGTLAATGGSQPANVTYLSQLAGVTGGATPTSYSVGGTTAADNTTAINTLLATATSFAPVVIVVDGYFAVNTLILPTGGHFAIVGQGWDTGFVVQNGTNGEFCKTTGANWYPVSSIASTVGSNVTFSNFRVTFNRGDGTTGDSTTGDPRGPLTFTSGNTPWFVGFLLWQYENVVFNRIWVYDAPTYCINLFTCNRVWIDDCRFEAPSLASNTDGVHFNGYCYDIFIRGCWFHTGDDAIAINFDENNTNSAGPGYRVTVGNCHFDSCNSWFRTYGELQQASEIEFGGCTGTVTRVLMYNGIDSTTTAVDATKTVHIHDCTIKFNSGTSDAIPLTSGVGLLRIADTTFYDGSADNAYIVNTSIPGNQVAAIELDNVVIHRSAGGSGRLGLLRLGTAIVNRVTVNNCSAENAYGTSYTDTSPLISVATSSQYIGQMAISNLTAENVGTVLSVTSGSINDLRINGLRHTSAAGSSGSVSVSGGFVRSARLDRFVLGNVTAPVTSGTPANCYSLGGDALLRYAQAIPDYNAAPGLTYLSSSQGNALATRDALGRTTLLTTSAGSGVASSAKYAAVFTRTANSNKGAPLYHADAAAYRLTTAGWTMGLFVKPSAASTQMGLITKWYQGTASQQDYMLVLNQAPNIWSFFWSESSGVVKEIDSTTHPSSSRWDCLIVQYQTGDGKVHFFVNDTEESAAVATSAFLTSAAEWQLGNNTNPNTWAFGGSMANVFYVPSVLSGTDLTWFYNSGSGQAPADIYARAGFSGMSWFYPFVNRDYPPYTLGVDYSGSGNTLAPKYTGGGLDSGAGPG